MLESLTADSFAPHTGTIFRLRHDGSAEGEDLRLVSVRRLGKHVPGSRRESFSLLFAAPAGTHFPQKIYPLEHHAMGRLEIFIVPLGGGQYEAIFT